MALLVLSSLVVLYALPLASAGFVYDDWWTIVRNPAIREITPLKFFLDASTVAVPGSGMSLDIYRPLATLSFAFDYRFWGLSSPAFHGAQYVWHGLNGWLLWVLLVRLGIKPSAACAGLVAFLIHPGQIETVAWATQRSMLLCAFGCLIAAHGLLIVGRRPVWGAILGWGGWVVALSSKETAVIWPGVAALLDWMKCFPEEGARARRKLYGGWALSVPLFLLWRDHLIGGWSSAEPLRDVLSRLALGTRALPLYLWKMVAPSGIRVSYDTPVMTPAMFVLFVLLSGLILVFAGWALWRRKSVGVSLGWILLGLAPALHLVPIVPFFAERFLYLPMMGLAWGVARLWQDFPRWRGAVLLWGMGLALVSGRSVSAWQSDQTLWAHAVEQEPTNAFAQLCYADTLRATDPQQAQRHYQAAWQSRPTLGQKLAIANNLGQMLFAQNRLDDAGMWIAKALALDPSLPQARFHHYQYLKRKGRRADAQKLRRELEQDPRIPKGVLD